ncbi:uncharacterized protein LOC116160261 [Photinus pyralis]|uniref:uncharacterized protein LOC116160261 n=1 Tax=Photinus pyralis TaxID=7054 RepID=UPI001266FDAF|nr:uncharacterized protein LOC116160261 [Photinus pyralis]
MSGFNNALYKLKTTHKWLQTSHIAHLKRQLGYAIKQNKGDVEGVRAAIMNIENHSFGEHEECSDRCKAKEDPDNYVYKGLPRQKKFSETDQPGWRAALHVLLSGQAAMAHTLAPCGSTQQNESFNHMCVTRAPKSRHYCGTEANFFRVSAAVCEKNLGSTYAEAVFQKATLSPSVFRTREKLQHRKMVKALSQARPDIKARRLHNKMKNSWKATNNNEGLTYESGMGNVMERASAAVSVGSAWLPDALQPTESCVPVIIDLETTGFQAADEIVQIAVKCGSMEKSWYMIPKKNFHVKAAEVTGLKMTAGKLYHHGVCVSTTPPKEIVNQLLHFLQQCGDSVFLVGHNIIRFDAPRLIKFLKEHGEVKAFAECVAGFSDTMPLLKQGKVCKQSALAETYLTGPYWEELHKSAHNAVTDCSVLDRLLNQSSIKVSPTRVRENMVTFRDFLKRQAELKRRKAIMPSLEALFSVGVSKAMVGKMAAAGVTIEELKREYDANKVQGLTVCLGVQVDGKPRVTTQKKTIEKLELFFSGK